MTRRRGLLQRVCFDQYFHPTSNRKFEFEDIFDNFVCIHFHVGFQEAIFEIIRNQQVLYGTVFPIDLHKFKVIRLYEFEAILK